ncbi:uncharacterized protein LOC111756174 isoform X2 [Cavia porcellus]|uniref:uncharacterized protein LOC111756174 isoform X2 n=1 Tax=Cavia porcellus TaxID=10141 RepID=UPI002FE33A86
MLRGAESAGRRVHCGLRPTPDHQSEVTRGSVSTPPPQGVPRISRSPLEPRPGPAGLLTRRWKQTGLTRATSAASGCERKRPTQGAGVNCYPEASERVRRCARAPTSDVMQRSANDDRRGAMIWVIGSDSGAALQMIGHTRPPDRWLPNGPLLWNLLLRMFMGFQIPLSAHKSEISCGRQLEKKLITDISVTYVHSPVKLSWPKHLAPASTWASTFIPSTPLGSSSAPSASRN